MIRRPHLTKAISETRSVLHRNNRTAIQMVIQIAIQINVRLESLSQFHVNWIVNSNRFLRLVHKNGAKTLGQKVTFYYTWLLDYFTGFA